MRLSFVFAVLLSSHLSGQALSFGFRAGIPLVPALAGGAAGMPATFGPSVELRLWRGAGVAGDFLLRRATVAGGSEAMWRWDAPVTAVYRFPGPVRPFVRAGVAFNRVFKGASLGELRHAGTSGFVAGAGVRILVAGLRLDPEVRFTRWRDRNFGTRDSAVRSNLSDVALMLGISF
ncbi:MAG: hypothetical protein JST11_17910 [Acidobacteria bacterium]|nr:hypothetical protein [Acidobacteriota bacterium]